MDQKEDELNKEKAQEKNNNANKANKEQGGNQI